MLKGSTMVYYLTEYTGRVNVNPRFREEEGRVVRAPAQPFPRLTCIPLLRAGGSLIAVTP